MMNLYGLLPVTGKEGSYCPDYGHSWDSCERQNTNLGVGSWHLSGRSNHGQT